MGDSQRSIFDSHRAPDFFGCGSKLSRRGYAGVGPCFHLAGFRFGGFLSLRSIPRKLSASGASRARSHSNRLGDVLGLLDRRARLLQAGGLELTLGRAKEADPVDLGVMGS